VHGLTATIRNPLRQQSRNSAICGSRPTNAITRRELIEQLEDSGSADRAGRVFNWLDEMYEELMNRDVVQSKPLGKKPTTLKPRKGAGFPSYGLQGIPKLVELYHRIRLADDLDGSSRLCHQTMILTGSRNTATRWMEASWVDFKKQQIVFPRSVQKQDDERRGDFVVPMSPQLAAVMKQAIERANHLETEYLFSSFKRRKPNENGIIEPVIDPNGLSKLMRDWTDRQHSPHGNRKCLVSWAVENMDIEEHVAKALLDHDPFTGALVHYNTAQFVKKRREVLDAWGQLFEVQS
jgi:integrase